MGAAFTMLFSKIAAVVAWFGKLFIQVFKDLWEVVLDAWTWPFEQIMKIIVSAVSAIDLSGIESYVNAAGALPAEIMNVLALLGIGIVFVITKMGPLFEVMQKRIDALNRVLREQITGIRVVRAFVREPFESRRFEQTNALLVDTTTRVGRLMAFLFLCAIVFWRKG